MFPGLAVNHSYTGRNDLDWFGVTLAMRNLYGMTPLAITVVAPA